MSKRRVPDYGQGGLSTLEEKDGDLAQVEVDGMPVLMGEVGTLEWDYFSVMGMGT